MALFIFQSGLTPLGDFDCLDTDQASILGGEVMCLDEAAAANSATEKAAYDVFDGYIANAVSENSPTRTRTIARIADESTETYNLFYLSDEGTTSYGVMFGSVIGAPVGQSTTGTNLGPHTQSGSGKVTLWGMAGMYGVSLTALATDVVPTTTGAGSAAVNLYDTPLPGDLLYRSTAGRLTRATGTSDKIALFVELTNNGSLVTTPAKLVGAAETFDRIKIQYLGATHNA